MTAKEGVGLLCHHQDVGKEWEMSGDKEIWPLAELKTEVEPKKEAIAHVMGGETKGEGQRKKYRTTTCCQGGDIEPDSYRHGR